MLAQYPRIGRRETGTNIPRHADREVRRFPVQGFPEYLILYTAGEDFISLERVLHGTRDPSLHLADPS